jgi:hypothetical protein
MRLCKLSSLLSVSALFSITCLIAAPAAAQWPTYPTRNVPQNADGTPNLSAPAPRTRQGRIDFTGIWEIVPGAIGGGSQSRDQGQPELPAQDDGQPPFATFFDIGANIEGGAPYQDWARELRDQRVADGMKDNPDAHCLPMGHMQFHLHPQPRKIIQTEDVIVILYEGNAGIRQIFLDGRTTPDNDPLPWWYGYSWGRWEGDELVVTTTHMKDTWLDVNGSPFTENGTIIEHWRRPGFGEMQIDVTIDDPTAYTRPFTVRVEHKIMLDTNLIEFVCIENEQSTQHFDP